METRSARQRSDSATRWQQVPRLERFQHPLDSEALAQVIDSWDRAPAIVATHGSIAGTSPNSRSIAEYASGSNCGPSAPPRANPKVRMTRRLALRPKSSAVATRPSQIPCQIRFTIERAVVGDRRSANQRAKSSRLAFTFVLSSCSSGGKNAGTPGETSSAGARKLPRSSRCVERQDSRSSSASCVAPCG